MNLQFTNDFIEQYFELIIYLGKFEEAESMIKNGVSVNVKDQLGNMLDL